MTSLQSSSSLPAATRRNLPSADDDQTTREETQRQARHLQHDGGDNDQVAGTRHLPLSTSRSSSCNDTPSTTSQQHENQRRGVELEQQSRSSSSEEEQEQEQSEVVLPATSTSMSQKAMFVLRPVHRYIDLVCIALSVMAYLLETTLNAALAIFGIGVGVGLVLGDSFRAALPLLPAVQQQQQGMAMQNTMTSQGGTTEIMMPRSVPNLLPAQ